MKRVVLGFCLLLGLATNAASLSHENKLQQVGEARFQFLFWDVYDSALFSQDGQYVASVDVAVQLPLKLKIKYLREIKADDLVENTVEQWQHLGLDEHAIAKHTSRITDLWPNIKDQDQLALVVTPEASYFYFNDEPLGQALPVEFGVDFLQIWLSEQTSQPKLRKKLISGGDK